MYAVDPMPINDHPQRGRFQIEPREATSFAVGSQGVETADKDAAVGPVPARSGG
jgi:hypothetical protein